MSELKLPVGILREKFYSKLQSKTGWGRNEIKDKFNEAVADTAVELLEKKEGDNNG